MDSNPICHPSPARKMKCFFLDYVHFWWSAWLIDELEPHLTPLSYQKNEMLNFWLRSTSDDQPSWSMDSNPICHPSPAKKMKCFFFGLHSTSDNWPGWVMDSNPIHHPSPAKNMKCLFLYNIQHLMLARLVNGHKPHPPPIFSQKMTCSFLDYVQLLNIGQAGRYTRTPYATPLQPIKWNAHFWNMFTSDEQPGWSINSNPICQPSPAKKMKCYFLDYVQLLMIGWASQWTQTPSSTSLQPKKWNASFWIMFTSDDQPGWLMNLNPI